MSAFRDLMRHRITCRDENSRLWFGHSNCREDWCVRLDGHLLSAHSSRGGAISNAVEARNSLTSLKALVMDRVAELGEMVEDAIVEGRTDEALSLSDERMALLRALREVRRSWQLRLSQHEDVAPNVHAVLREMREAARAAF